MIRALGSRRSFGWAVLLAATLQLGAAHADPLRGGSGVRDRAARWGSNLRRGTGAVLTSIVPRTSRVEEHAANATTAALAAADFTPPQVFQALAAVGGPVMVGISAKDSLKRIRERVHGRGPGARLSLRDLQDPAHLNNLSGVAWGTEMPLWAAAATPKLAGLAKVAAGIGTAGAVCQLGFACTQIRAGLRARDAWQIAAGVSNIVGAVGWAGAELSGHPAFAALFLGGMAATTAIDNREGIGRALGRAKRGISSISARTRAAACRFGKCVSSAISGLRGRAGAAPNASWKQSGFGGPHAWAHPSPRSAISTAADQLR